jgi:hypothetical protein
MTNIKLEITCPFCGNTSVFTLPKSKVEAWKNGELIQNVFPEWSPSYREVLISGVCVECQADIFSEEEDDE